MATAVKVIQMRIKMIQQVNILLHRQINYMLKRQIMNLRKELNLKIVKSIAEILNHSGLYWKNKTKNKLHILVIGSSGGGN